MQTHSSTFTLKKTLTTLLLMLSFALNSSFYKLSKQNKPFSSNLKSLMERSSRFLPKTKAERDSLYNYFKTNNVKETYWTIGEAKRSLDYSKKGIIMRLENSNEKQFFVDGLGKGVCDGVIDMYQGKKDFLAGDAIESAFLKTFHRGLYKYPDHFYKEIELEQINLIKLIETNRINPKSISEFNIEGQSRGVYLVPLYHTYLILTPQSIEIDSGEDKLIIEYKGFVPDSHQEAYSLTRELCNIANDL